MKKILKVPFYSNTKDNTHCFQAAMKMVLKYFEPDKNFTWKQLEKLSAKKEGKSTWPTAMTLNLIRMGYKVESWENYNYQAFVDDPEKYLIKQYGKKVAKWQISRSDIEQERKLMKKFIKLGKWDSKIPNHKDIRAYIKKGYLVCCNINGFALSNKQGYAGHFVLVIGYENDHLIIHNPGLPPRKNQKAEIKLFEKAWAYPTSKAKFLMAIKKIK